MTPAEVSVGGLVLIAEDEEPVRVLVRRVLERAGYDVIATSNGREALEILAREPRAVRLVISDVVMPELGGVELARAIRERWPDTRVLLVSGYAAGEIDRRGGLPEGVRCLQKPFGPGSLTAAVRDALADDS